MAKRVTNDQIAAALRETKGMVYLAARRIGCAPETIYKRLKVSPDLKAIHDAAAGEVGDVAELKLYQAIQDGAPWAITFYLKTKGRNRGYTERQEITGADGNAIVVQYERALTQAYGDDSSDPPTE